MKSSLFYSILIACISVLSTDIHAQAKAFPTAEGFGRNATGGRGGKVVEVTTTEDDATNPPEGSLRWALTQYPGQPVTIVFRVSGIINLAGGKTGELRCKRDNYTIAGQTAPGDGICIMGNKVNLGGSNNLIVRHLRFRIGTMIDPVTGEPDASGKGSIGIENASNFILDHCTFGWSGEENMTIYDNINTTIQWCIIHEGLYQSGHNKGNRGYGMQWGGQNATFHHNLLAHNHNRTPRFNGARSNDVNVLIDYVNNVNYNWGKANSCYGSDIENVSNKTNFVNNYYKPGPARPGTSSSYFTQSSFSSSQSTSRIALWYMSGNYMEGSANVAKNTDNYLGLDASAYVSKGIDASKLKSETPFEIAYPVTTETAAEAYESVLAGAGAFPRDEVDIRIVDEVRNGTASGSGVFGTNKGIIDSPDAVGGYPEYDTSDVPVDSDHDGMPDEWEIVHNLNPNDPDDRNYLTQSGYTVLEVYLNELAGENIELNIVSAIDKIRDNTTWDIIKKEGRLYISSQNSIVSSIKIVNILGQRIVAETTGTISSVDISALPAGVYLAEAINFNQEKKVLKFSVNK
jgi:pectate lyase